jgi:CRP/FNR family transcriptional regulator
MNTSDFLRSLPYFAELGPEQLSHLRSLLATREFEKGEVVMLEGEPCRGLYFVRSGRVRVFKASADGREQVLRIVETGDTFNEVPNFDGGPNPASADAIEPSTIYLLRRAHLLQIARQNPTVAMSLLKLFAGRLRHLTGLVEDLSFKHVTSRLAKILLEYAAEPGEEDGDAALRRRLTQQEMAAMIGTAREMVGRSLKTLEAQGALTIDRHRITIKDRSILQRMV